MINNIHFEEFNIICRFCLNRNEILKSIFTNDTNITAENINDVNANENVCTESIIDSNNIIHLISTCIGIKITKNDGYPILICKVCLEQLFEYNKFRKKCYESAKYLEKIKLNYEQKLFTIEENLQEIETLHQIANNSETSEITNKNSEYIISNAVKEKLQEKIEPDNILEKFHKCKRNKSEKLDNRKVCQICGTKQTNLKQHMMIHTGEKPFKCKFCKKEFSQVGHFQHHVNIHTGIKPYKCDVCEKSFPSPSGLTLHKVNHSNERKYRCEICGNLYSYSHNLAAHRRRHTQERKFECQHCYKMFMTADCLKKHVRIHTGERPYQCEFCAKSFISSSHLSSHVRSHTKERPYKCAICSMDFTYSSVLNNHMKVHTHERPYKCNICMLNFAYANVLANHMKVHTVFIAKSIDDDNNVIIKKHKTKLQTSNNKRRNYQNKNIKQMKACNDNDKVKTGQKRSTF